MEKKICTKKDKCVHPDGPELIHAEFHKAKANKDGLAYICKECAKAHAKQHYLDNIERQRELRKQYGLDYKEDKDKKAKSNKRWEENHGKAWRTKNKEKIAKRAKQSYLDNKQHIKAMNKQWKQNNPGKHNANTVNYKARKLKRTMAWGNKEEIRQIYIKCAKMNRAAKAAGLLVRYEVDHVIPLLGRLVSGLHVENNLQILTKEENCSKNNKFTPQFSASLP